MLRGFLAARKHIVEIVNITQTGNNKLIAIPRGTEQLDLGFNPQ